MYVIRKYIKFNYSELCLIHFVLRFFLSYTFGVVSNDEYERILKINRHIVRLIQEKDKLHP